MRIIQGNDFMDMLMKSPGTCPNCGTALIFEDAAQLAKSHGITDNVVMCKGCNRVFQINMVPGRMTLTNDVTANYPQLQPAAPGAEPKPEPTPETKSETKPEPTPEQKPRPKPRLVSMPEPEPEPKPEPTPKKRGFFARLFGK